MSEVNNVNKNINIKKKNTIPLNTNMNYRSRTYNVNYLIKQVTFKNVYSFITSSQIV